MFSYGDLPPFPKKFSDVWKIFTNSWQYEKLGFPRHVSSHYFFNGLLIFIIKNPILAQKIALLSMIPIASISMYLFTDTFLKSDSTRFLTSILYGFNPVTIGRFGNGGIELFSLYAIAPLFWMYLKRIFEKVKIRDILIFLILFGSFGTNLWSSFWVIVPFSVLLILMNIKRIINKNILRGVIVLLLSISGGVILNLPSLLAILQMSQYVKTSFESVVMEHVKYCYSNAIIPLLIRLVQGKGNFMMNELGYNRFEWWTLPGYVFPLIALFSFLRLPTEKTMREFVGLFSILIVSIIAFCSITSLGYTYPLFYTFRFLSSIRNPLKLMYPLSLAICSMFGIGLHQIIKWVKVSRFKLPILIFLTASNILYMYPIFSGDMGLTHAWGDEFIVPDEYNGITNFLNQKRESGEYFRTLWLPYTYTVQLRLFYSDPYEIGNRLNAKTYGDPNIGFIKEIFDIIADARVTNFGEILSVLSVKYVIIDLKLCNTNNIQIFYNQNAYWITGNANEFSTFLDKQSSLKRIYEDKYFIVYENNKFVIPHLFKYEHCLFLFNPRSSSNKILSDNLIQNSGFEEDFKLWWKDEKASIDNNITYLGKNSAKITNYDTTENSYATIAFCLSGVQQDRAYRFSAYLKTKYAIGTHFKVLWYQEPNEELRVDYILSKTAQPVTSNWTYVVVEVQPPPNAQKLVIELKGGLSLDGIIPAITWFDNIECNECIVPPPSTALRNFLILSEFPSFDSSKHLVIFNNALSDEETLKALNVTDTVVFLNPSTEDIQKYSQYIRKKGFLEIFEAETLPLRGEPFFNDSMSNGVAVKFEGVGEKYIKFQVPRNGFYNLGLKCSFVNISIQVDTRKLHINYDSNYYVSERVMLEKGNHELKFKYQDGSLDQIIILSSDIMPFLGYSSSQKSESEPFFIFFSESYHDNWKASIGDEDLKHFKAFGWGNAFYHPLKVGEVKFTFISQLLRNIMLLVWAFSWLILGFSSLYVFYGDGQKLFFRIRYICERIWNIKLLKKYVKGMKIKNLKETE